MRCRFCFGERERHGAKSGTTTEVPATNLIDINCVQKKSEEDN